MGERGGEGKGAVKRGERGGREGSRKEGERGETEGRREGREGGTHPLAIPLAILRRRGVGMRAQVWMSWWRLEG